MSIVETGYRLIDIAEAMIRDDGIVLQEIREISSSATRPGIMVFLSGGNQGWFSDPAFAEAIFSLMEGGWRVETFAWTSSITIDESWYTINTETLRFQNLDTFF